MKSQIINICYSPYSVDYYYTKDIKFEPGKTVSKDFKEISDGFKLIGVLTGLDQFWVPNIDYFGKLENIESLELNKDNIENAKLNISSLYNDIRKKKILITFFSTDYKYDDIINTKEDEIKNYGIFFEFIYWLISNKTKVEKKIEMLINIFQKIEASKNMFKYLENLDNNETLTPIIYHNIIFNLRELLIKRYNLLEKYKFNASACFREIEKEKYMINISKFYPPYNETEFINKINVKYKVEKKIIKGELSNIWMFSEFESKPNPCQEILNPNEKFDLISETINEENKLNLNLKKLEISDLSQANSLDKIISVLKNGYLFQKDLFFI